MKINKRERIGVLVAAVIALLAVSLPGAASAKDRNQDRIPDRWERSHKLTLKKDQRKLDQDSDGLKNRAEWLSDTNPRDKDSDDDGVSDLKEKAGVISSFDAETGDLTLTLYAGGELSGSVTDETEVQCESQESEATEDDGSSDDPAAESASSDDGFTQGEGHQSHGNGKGRGHDRHGCGGNCSVDDLAEGVEVTEAVVKYTASGKVFKELEIVVSSDG